jgi:hypothetical protein
MKKFLLVLLTGFFFCAGISAQDQQFGVGGHLFISRGLREDNAPKYNPLNFGFRAEVLKTKFGADRVSFAYMSFAPSLLIIPKNEFIMYGRDTQTQDQVDVKGSASGMQVDGTFKFGFCIPQRWNEFLFLNFGGGGGVVYSSATATLDGDYPHVYFDREWVDQRNKKSVSVLEDIFFTAFYEFDRFYLYFQEDAIYNLSPSALEGMMAFRTNFGIYYPLNHQ